MTPKFRKIEYPVFHALMAVGLTGAGYQIALTIVDRTMGFRKGSKYKEYSPIAMTYFENETGLSHQSVRLAIKELEKRRIITVKRNSTRKAIYGLNIDTSMWEIRKLNHPNSLGNQITPNWETKSPQTRQPALASHMRTKENIKEILKENMGKGKERDTGDTFSLESNDVDILEDRDINTLDTLDSSRNAPALSLGLRKNVGNVPSKEHLLPEHYSPSKKVTPIKLSSYPRDTDYSTRYEHATSILGMPPEEAEEQLLRFHVKNIPYLSVNIEDVLVGLKGTDDDLVIIRDRVNEEIEKDVSLPF
jgi:DNA-binding transcriptional regulator GbsR (MarR family)